MPHSFFAARSGRTLSRLFLEDAGQTMVMAALMLPVLMGSVGMAVDVGYAFDYRRQMQMAADSGALAGARAVRANPAISASDLVQVVALDTKQNGFTRGSKRITMTVCRPGVDTGCTTQYGYAPSNEAVKVTINQPKATFFSGVLGLKSMNIGVTAVAAGAPSALNTANIIVLDDQCTSSAFQAAGGVPVTVNGRVWVNSCDQYGTKASGGTNVSASDGIYMGCNYSGTCGGYQEQGGSVFSPTPTSGGEQVADPLEDLPEPVPFGPTFNDPNINSGSVTLQPGIYDKGITIHGGTVTFAPGIYFLDGKPLSIKGGATVLGTGVMFYAYNQGSLIIQDNTTTVTMSAPTSGTYRGIWWFQQRSNNKDATITAGPLVNISGTFYISNPEAELSFSGNSNSGVLAEYTVFVVWRFKVTGGATFNSNFTSIGGTPLRGLLALSE